MTAADADCVEKTQAVIIAISDVFWVVFIILEEVFIERQKCGTAEIGRPERSERGTLSAVATTVLLGFFFVIER